MTYSAQAAAAKAQARDILRTEMAIRIQRRISEAAAALNKIFRHIASVAVSTTEIDADNAKDAAELADERAAEDAALAAIPGITPDELTALQAEVAKERADEDAEAAAAEKRIQESRAEVALSQAKDIAAARDAVAHAEDNLAKLESGELKVDREKLDALTNKLLEEGRVEAGTATEVAEAEAEG